MGRTTLSQAVTEELLERIRGGYYLPGTRLSTEKELMAEFDVGRNVVREAIHSLVSMGLVDVRPGRGATVTSIDSANAIGSDALFSLLLDAAVDHLNDFRKVIEVEIAGRAAINASDSDLAEMRVHLDEFARRFHNNLSVTEPELAFHRLIATASGNAIYPQVLDALRDRLATARKLASLVVGITARAMEDHEAIFVAISNHNETEAREAMSRHLDLAIEAISTARYMHSSLTVVERQPAQAAGL